MRNLVRVGEPTQRRLFGACIHYSVSFARTGILPLSFTAPSQMPSRLPDVQQELELLMNKLIKQTINSLDQWYEHHLRTIYVFLKNLVSRQDI